MWPQLKASGILHALKTNPFHSIELLGYSILGCRNTFSKTAAKQYSHYVLIFNDI